MADMAEPPRNQPALLAASDAHPSTVYGPWVLAATILGSSMPSLTAQS